MGKYQGVTNTPQILTVIHFNHRYGAWVHVCTYVLVRTWVHVGKVNYMHNATTLVRSPMK